MKAQWNKYPNFSKEEFDCKETGENDMQHEFMEKVQELRTAYGKPMVVNSGFRSYEHSIEKRKPNKDGTHPLGLASDFKVDRGDAYLLTKLAFEFGFTGVGWKQHGGGRFVHLDIAPSTNTRIRPTVWSYR
jgi:uncharacterized protein YcbK (DUF882 family)